MSNTVSAKTRAASGSSTAMRPATRQVLSSDDRNRVNDAPEHLTPARRQRLERRGGSAPRRAACDGHYLIFLICFSDCATTLAGRGWKFTCAR